MVDVVGALIKAGFSEQLAIAKAELLGQCIRAIGGPPAHLFHVPGRVELLGKHTDYAGGRSFTCAIDRGIIVAARPSHDSHCRAFACDLKQSVGFELSPQLRVSHLGWTNYVLSAARRFSRDFGSPWRGVDFAFASDLPQAGGLSSSSALVIATYLALDSANHFAARSGYVQNIRSTEELAGYLGACESGRTFGAFPGDHGVGTFGGSEDHTAILCSVRNQPAIYSYNPVRLERRLIWPDELSLLVAVSGVVAEKTAKARARYNRLSHQADAVLTVLRSQGWEKPTLAAVIGDDRAAVECVVRSLQQSRHAEYRPADLIMRFCQFAEEHQRWVPALADALARKDWAALGQVAESSQSLAQTNLGNQVPQTIWLVRRARQLGAVAASAFGAGFGGAVWAMCPREQADDFLAEWEAVYRAAFPDQTQAKFFATRPMGGAMRIE